jgi:hypothetical protein
VPAGIRKRSRRRGAGAATIITRGGQAMLNRILATALVLVIGSVSLAEEKKEVTLKGTIVCAKCKLKETDKCTTAIQVKEGDKEVTYYLDDKGNKEEYHEKICTGPAKGSVTGVVAEKDKKKFITPSKGGVKFD